MQTKPSLLKTTLFVEAGRNSEQVFNFHTAARVKHFKEFNFYSGFNDMRLSNKVMANQ